MYKYNDLRLNDVLKNSETYTFVRLNEAPKDPKDKIIRAFLITNEILKEIKKKPNESVLFDDKKEIKLENGKYITSNGKIINVDTFNKVYKLSSPFIKNFLIKKELATNNMLDIIERIHGTKKNIPANKRKL